jgi:spermidine/putrescine transport system substrate-binding protein
MSEKGRLIRRRRGNIDRAIVRVLARRPITRRHFLQGSVLAGTAATLAACGIAPQATPSPTPLATPTPGATPGVTPGETPVATPGETPTPTPEPTPAEPVGQLTFGNWPLYIDIDEDTGGYPTLEAFTEETDIRVTYLEDINDNEEFFGRIQPDLAAGNPTGYDLIVLTDWMIERMIRLGYLDELDHSMLPNFAANAQDLYRDPYFDPGRRYSLTWQGGTTGIGYFPKHTGREITTFDDLLDPAFRGRVGMFSEMRDTMFMAVLSLGINPENATVDDARRAQQKLLEAAERGQFRAFYGNDYYDFLAREDIIISMAWSGDVSQMKLFDNEDVEYVVPDSGGNIWADNMCIPRHAPGIVDAHMMMNFWYELENAVPLTEYIGFFSPVVGVAEQVAADAEEARAEGDDEWADALEVISQTAFPDEETLAKVFPGKILDEAEEREWNNLFNALVAG